MQIFFLKTIVFTKYYGRIIVPSYDRNGVLNYFISRLYTKESWRTKYENPEANKKKIIYRKDILTDIPNWISNSYFFKNKLLIKDDKILLIDNLGKIAFEQKISTLIRLI